MCGLGGFCGGFGPSLLTAMSVSMCHRGPDDQGEWLGAEGAVGLAHRRLSIVDTSTRGRQPLADEGGASAIAFNGEIYNFRQIREELVASGVSFRSNTDTEVLLNLWLQRGPEALERIDGMYAFALWDSRRDRLYLARDPYGVKPLYWAQSASGITFASEIKALLQNPEIPRVVSPEAVVSHLMYLWSPGEQTMISGVEKLAPGRWLEISQGKVVASGEMTLPAVNRTRSKVSPLDVRAALARSVESQLVADVPVGAFLSGGLDSTSIVALAREHQPDLDCFTIAGGKEESASEGFGDDTQFAISAAKALGVRLHVAEATPDLVADVDFMLYHLDEPQADLAPLSVYYISVLARSMGVKVLLSGAGGDDLFGGYRRHSAVRLEAVWRFLPLTVRQEISRGAAGLSTSHGTSRRIRKALGNVGLDGDERVISYLHWIDRSSALGVLAPEFVAGIGAHGADRAARQILSRLPQGSSDLSRLLALDEKLFLVDHNLNYTDKMSMAAGVEVRVPFLDRGVVDTAHAIRESQLVKGFTSKHILRQAAVGLVPDDIIRRPKVGFGVPLRSWMAGPLAPWMRDQLDPSVIRARGIFDVGGVERLVAANNEGRIDATYTLLSIAFIERWLQLFVDQVPVSPPHSPAAGLSWRTVT